jgi:Domain of unknown function (DUF6456)
MAKPTRAGKALVASEALAVLASLACDGAYVDAAGFSAGAARKFAVYSPRNGFTQPVAEMSRSAAALSLRKGWITPDGSQARLRISAAGLRALRTGSRATAIKPRAVHQGEAAARAGKAAADGALAWLRGRKDKDGRPLITDIQFQAGERLATDFWEAGLSPRVTANWSAAAPGRRMRRATPGMGVDMRDAVVAARQRFQRALHAVGPELAGILVDVCCYDAGLEAAGRAAGWPQRAAKVVLDLALTRLARHYGLIPPEHPAAARLRHWGDADYRPTLEAWR